MALLQRARDLFGTNRQQFGTQGRTWPPKRLSLALQGGGSFGAFTWGVLDRLLDEPGIDVDAISGASAGAVNGVLFAAGMLDGRTAAKEALDRFWRHMSKAASFMPLTSLVTATLGPGFDFFARSMSPQQFNPFDLNPLREALAREIDFTALRARSPMKLLIAATRVRDGELRIFREGELSIDMVLASSCLPLVHRTVEIEGEAYWDGGYVANPPIAPLVLAAHTEHLLVVQIMPAKTERLPALPRDIAKRIEQINFNATLNAEIAALNVAMTLGASPRLSGLRIDRLAAHDEINGLAEEDVANLSWRFLESLRDSGRRAAETWITQSVVAA